MIHVSNFRPVKRIDAVLGIFALHDGEGAGSAAAGRRRSGFGRSTGWESRARTLAHLVDAVGAQEAVIPLLSAADVFLLPSAQESFGLAALEAMACEVPVVASRRRWAAGGDRSRAHGISPRAR